MTTARLINEIQEYENAGMSDSEIMAMICDEVDECFYNGEPIDKFVLKFVGLA